MSKSNVAQLSIAAPVVNAEVAALQAQLAALQAENAKLQSKATLSGGLRVSEKGAISVYGLGRFPVTLYAEQFVKLLAMKAQIEEFIETNKEKLSKKPTK
jgi:hypothetical protein